jgi:CRP/FNR family cyclic AMP-dependent transcriptional regulator
MTTKSEILRAVPLFQGMTDRAIEAIGEIATETEFPADHVLVRQGDPGDAFVVIVDGAARVEQDGGPIRQLGSGDYLGEVSLIDGGPRTATVISTAPTRALVIDRDGFGRLMNEFAVVRLDLLNSLTQRLREYAPVTLD